ncbi:hypothetical protein GMDG_05293 [Pseudogymnoascus destructans 20631-21]|uniref:DNA mismatch repair proteins mutS family domain-containing protein n=1 Tax=Pseudogymnoascus destructans (strain ATCC MYA-4855 / 20631-21) TaxID=658429 RepID=L8FNM5_PSED2|nr:hypothetical protein GMDG_05293 [Pseudogymnoascus destructans 20631-21]
MYSLIEEEVIGSKIVCVDRRYWSEPAGMDFIQQLAFPEDVEAIKVATGGNFYATCCLAASLRYMEHSLSLTFASHSLRIKYQPSEGSMMIDLSTIRSLELIQNITNVKSKDCLFGLLNETLTPMGSRMLRSNILQPSTQESILKNRYKAVGELASTEETFFDTRNGKHIMDSLKPFLDIDKLLTNLIIQPTQPDIQHSEQSINHILMLKTFVQCVGPVYEALSGARSPLLVDIRNVCRPNNITPTLKIIGEVINDDVTFQRSPLDLRNQRTYAVKSGVNGLLDVARQTFKEATQDVHQHVSDINDQYEMQMETRYDNARRYYLRIQESNLEGRTMPDILINCYRKKGYIECQTLGLVKLNQRIEDSHQEVVLMSDKTVTQLIDNVRAEIQPLFRVSDSIAMLDMLAAFAQLVTTSDYVKPEITRCLAIKSGRHPVHEKAHSEKFIPNDVYADKQQRFQIITGCNMSGKSTYIRSIALVTVMAQIGSFVPAQYASFPIVDQLFARVSMDDCIEANVSTFASEMRETAFILRNIGKNSLVIIDELGRGTSTRDGLAIALSISEALVESQAFVWFTTHFRELAQIMNERAGVVNMHLKVDISQEDKMVMLYKIANGFVKEEHYGLALARVVNLPPLVLEVAEKVSKTLQAQAAAKKKSSKSFAIARKRKLVLSLREVLLQAQESAMQGKALMEYLRKVQEEFVRRMDCIENEADDSGDESVIGEEELNENDDGRNEDLEREGEFNEAEDDSDESEMTGTDKTEMLV